MCSDHTAVASAADSRQPAEGVRAGCHRSRRARDTPGSFRPSAGTRLVDAADDGTDGPAKQTKRDASTAGVPPPFVFAYQSLR